MNRQYFSEFSEKAWDRIEHDFFYAVERLDNEVTHYRQVVSGFYNPDAIKEQVQPIIESVAFDIVKTLNPLISVLKTDLVVLESLTDRQSEYREIAEQVTNFVVDFSNQNIVESMLSAFFFEAFKKGGTIRDRLKEVALFLDK